MTNGPPVAESVSCDDDSDSITDTISVSSLATGSAITINTALSNNKLSDNKKSSAVQNLVINPSALSAVQSRVSTLNVQQSQVIDCTTAEQNIMHGELTNVTSQTGVVVLPYNSCTKCLPYIPFSAVPQSGSILPGSSAEILVKFAPMDVEMYYAKLLAWYE